MQAVYPTPIWNAPVGVAGFKGMNAVHPAMPTNMTPAMQWLFFRSLFAQPTGVNERSALNAVLSQWQGTSTTQPPAGTAGLLVAAGLLPSFPPDGVRPNPTAPSAAVGVPRQVGIVSPPRDHRDTQDNVAAKLRAAGLAIGGDVGSPPAAPAPPPPPPQCVSPPSHAISPPAPPVEAPPPPSSGLLPAVRSKVRAKGGSYCTADLKGNPGTWRIGLGQSAVVAAAEGEQLRLRDPLGKVSAWVPVGDFYVVSDDGDDVAVLPPTRPEPPQQRTSPPIPDVVAESANFDSRATLHLRTNGSGIDVRALARGREPRGTSPPLGWPEQQRFGPSPVSPRGARGNRRRSPNSLMRRYPSLKMDSDGLVHPDDLCFTQNTIAPTFSGGNHKGARLTETLEKLRAGDLSIYDFPVISVFEEGGRWYSVNNRRLWIFKQHGERIPVIPGPRGNAALTATPGEEPAIRQLSKSEKNRERREREQQLEREGEQQEREKEGGRNTPSSQ
eukprot:Hpha_TRINITY_DN16767_c0_g3::TRINITY_DN16767_c0_g3_i1::g.76718::m.76718